MGQKKKISGTAEQGTNIGAKFGVVQASDVVLAKFIEIMAITANSMPFFT